MFSQLLNVSNYYLNPYALPIMLVSVLTLSIGFFVLKQNKNSIVNVSFFCKCFAITFWLFTMALIHLSRRVDEAIIWYRYFTFFGVVNIMPSLFFFAIAWSGEIKRKKKLVIINYAISYIFYALAIGTDKLISPYAMKRYFWGYYPIYKFWMIPFLFFFLIQIIISFSALYSAYKNEEIPTKKMQRKIVAVAALIAFTASLDFLPKVFNFSLYPFGYIPMFIYISLIAYSIVKYRTFDIETVIHKTVMWLVSFSLIIIPVLLLYKWFFPYIKSAIMQQVTFWIISFFSFSIYLRVVQPKIDHFFQRRLYNLEKISIHFTEDLVHLKGFSQVIQRIESTISDTLYPQQIEIFIYNETAKAYKLINVLKNSEHIVKSIERGPFLEWLTKNDKIAYKDFVDIDPDYAVIKKVANDYFYATESIVAMPLVLNDKMLGVINLSKKANLKRYSAADFNFLKTLKNQSTIAISNSLLYENTEEQVRERTKELVEVQKQLIQAEKMATVGTLAGGVAHEINNPLTAILTNVQMLLADADSVNPESKESLELIEEATKRCRTIVQKLMAYAKKPLEKTQVSKVDLSDVVKNVVSFLSYQLAQDNVNIIMEIKEDAYLLMGNQNELEQVLINIVLNAKDAIKEFKKSGEIQVSLFKNKDSMGIEVKDDGAGIPKEIIPKIFDPFFTTKDVGKGIGLGLSICQSIVEKHNGKIKVQSELDKGAVFTVQFAGIKGAAKTDNAARLAVPL